MIPIFITPIVVLDTVHILSEAFERYQQYNDRAVTMRAVMQQLFRPIHFTTPTTSAGFDSLALTAIPPGKVFGVFVAIDVLLAWLWSILFIPAYFMLLVFLGSFIIALLMMTLSFRSLLWGLLAMLHHQWQNPQIS